VERRRQGAPITEEAPITVASYGGGAGSVRGPGGGQPGAHG
jgi:hypothetical protein